jgi:hypothetical protein
MPYLPRLINHSSACGTDAAFSRRIWKRQALAT